MEQKFVTVPFDLAKAKQITNGELEGKIVDTYYHCEARIVDFNFITVIGKFIIIVSERNGDNEVYAICNEKGIIYLEKEGKFEDEPCFEIEIPEYLTFKDGDVIAYGNVDNNLNVAIFKEQMATTSHNGYASLGYHSNAIIYDYNGHTLNNARFATESEKQKLIEALQESTDPRAEECLKKLGVEAKTKCKFTAGQPVIGVDGRGEWRYDLFSHYKPGQLNGEYVCTGRSYKKILPFNEKNAVLLEKNTTKKIKY